MTEEDTPVIVMGIDEAQGSDDPARPLGQALVRWVPTDREQTYEEAVAEMEMAARRWTLAQY
jgi:hypothetical protein